MNMDIIELTNELNEYAKSYTEEKEIINEEDLIRAIYYIDNLYIKDELDVLIFLLSLNLCNAYAKQANNHELYRFKKDIATLINILTKEHIPNIKICMTNDKGNLYIFKICQIQFSFHDEKIVPIDEFYHEEMVWDTIKKQPCAKSLLDKCLENNLTNREITMTGKPIKILVNKLISDYHKNILTLEDILDNI